ncbi:TauD/TfdA family dioxygenase [Aquirufa antheringensis]|jgi:alpha-ketoglutarate-dependent taurine dioxygenase
MNQSKLQTDGFAEISGMKIEDLINSFDGDYNVEETELIPNKISSNYSKTLTSEYGVHAFPLHTDGAHRVIPPKWTILQYVDDYKSETATLLYDSKTLSDLNENEDLFYNEIYLVENGKHPFLTSLINKQVYSEPIFRWNKLVMKKLINKTGKTIDEYISSFQVRVTWSVGKILVIDNWRILHGREKLVMNEEHSRKIKRYNLTPV